MTDKSQSHSRLRATAPEFVPEFVPGFVPGFVPDFAPEFVPAPVPDLPMMLPQPLYYDQNPPLTAIPLQGTLQGLVFNYHEYSAQYNGDIHDVMYNAPSEPHQATDRNAPGEPDLHVTHPTLAPGQDTNLHSFPMAAELLCRCNGVAMWYPSSMMVNHVCHNTELQPQHAWNAASAYHEQEPYAMGVRREADQGQYRPYMPAGHGKSGAPPGAKGAARRERRELENRGAAVEHGMDVVRRGRPTKRASPEKQTWKKGAFQGKKGSKRN